MQLGSSRDVLENVVPMMASVEAAFDAQRMCVLPTMDDVTGDVSFVVSWKGVLALASMHDSGGVLQEPYDLMCGEPCLFSCS
jgi:hypothetical protein